MAAVAEHRQLWTVCLQCPKGEGSSRLWQQVLALPAAGRRRHRWPGAPEQLGAVPRVPASRPVPQPAGEFPHHRSSSCVFTFACAPPPLEL